MSPPVQLPSTRADKGEGNMTFMKQRKQWVPVSVVPSMLPTTAVAVVTGLHLFPTFIPITFVQKLPSVAHSVAEPTLEVLLVVHSLFEPTPKAPIELPPYSSSSSYYYYYYYNSFNSQPHGGTLEPTQITSPSGEQYRGYSFITGFKFRFTEL